MGKGQNLPSLVRVSSFDILMLGFVILFLLVGGWLPYILVFSGVSFIWSQLFLADICCQVHLPSSSSRVFLWTYGSYTLYTRIVEEQFNYIYLRSTVRVLHYGASQTGNPLIV